MLPHKLYSGFDLASGDTLKGSAQWMLMTIKIAINRSTSAHTMRVVFSVMIFVFYCPLIKNCIENIERRQTGKQVQVFACARSARGLFVFLDTLVVDDAFPVHAECEIVDIAIGIAITANVARAVFAMLFHSLHVGGKLHGKQCRRFFTA